MANQQQIRVPNLPFEKMVDDNGQPTSAEMTFRQTLVTGLQKNFGDEGLVPPSQPTDTITSIQDNKQLDPATGVSNFTCQGGTIIYDSTTNQLKVCILGGPTPVFKIVQVI